MNILNSEYSEYPEIPKNLDKSKPKIQVLLIRLTNFNNNTNFEIQLRSVRTINSNNLIHSKKITIFLRKKIKISRFHSLNLHNRPQILKFKGNCPLRTLMRNTKFI